MKRSYSDRGRVLSEKPAINEPFTKLPARELKSRPKDSGAAKPAGVPGKKPPQDKRLREGIRLFSIKSWEKALQELLLVDSAELAINEKMELTYYLGLCFTKLERFTDALPSLEKVVAVDTDLLRVYQCRMTLAYIHVVSGRPKMAEYELRRLLDSGFESPALFNTMAYAAYVRKHYRHAIEYYEKALKLEDSNATALNSMGYILVDTGIDPLKGLKCCRRAVELKPENAAYLDSLGWACYKCREPTAARNWLRKALALAPQELQIKEHLRIVTGGLA